MSRLSLRFTAFALVGGLISCGDGNVTLTPPPNETLIVQPSSLTFTVPQAQTLIATVKTKTTVYASSSDPNIVTVSPAVVNIDTLTTGLGTTTFTVVLHTAKKAVITVRSAYGEVAKVPVEASEAREIYVSDLQTIKTYNAAGSPTPPSITGSNLSGDLAVDASGDIYASNGNAIVTYDANGTPIKSTLTSGGVGAVVAGKLYALGSDVVTTYDLNGARTISTFSLGEPAYINAESMAVDGAGKLYVLTDDDTVHTYQANGTPSKPTITVRVPNPMYEGATGVAVDAGGKIYVAIDGGTVQTYMPDGSPTTPTIVTGPGAIPLQSLLPPPSAVTVDPVGKIYVTYLGTLFTYEPDGTRTTPTIVVAQPEDEYNVAPYAGIAVR